MANKSKGPLDLSIEPTATCNTMKGLADMLCVKKNYYDKINVIFSMIEKFQPLGFEHNINQLLGREVVSRSCLAKVTNFIYK